MQYDKYMEDVSSTLYRHKIGQIHSNKRSGRWQLQREAQALLPEERVAFCMRRLQAPKVDILYSPTHQSAHFNGLMVCGSVWVCPLCAAKISEQRRIELEQAIESCTEKGGVVYLATYTVAHNRYDNLSELLHAFLIARKKMRQGRAAQQLKQKFDILGTVSVREVTWSEVNGWHPHCHELVFFKHDIDANAYAEVMREKWQKSAENEGLSMNEHGFRLDKTHDSIADYIAKFGREPLQNSWSAATELTKAHMKHGRKEEHLTPFGILQCIAEGHDELKPVFLEYAQWFKGKHQLVWSAGLRSLLLTNDGEKSDIELAQESEDEVILLGQLDFHQWSIVLRKDARGQLLEVASSGDWLQVEDFLKTIGAYGTSPPSLGI